MVAIMAAGMVFSGLVPAAAAGHAAPPTGLISSLMGSTPSIFAAANKVTIIRTTANLNLRKRPGAQSPSMKILKKGTVVTRAGKASGTWWYVKAGKNLGWVSSTYLMTTTVSGQAVKPIPGPAVRGTRWIDGTQGIYAKATQSSKRLMAQTGGTKVKLLKTQGKWAYVQAPTGKGWIEKTSLATSAAKASGTSKTHRWTVTASNVRRGGSTKHASYGILPANQKVAFIKSSNGWSKIKTPKGTTGWIKNTQLTMIEYRAPKKLQPKTKAMINIVEKRYGSALSGIGGVRSGSSGHGAGLAADFMIRGYGTAAGIKAGDRVAAYLVTHHEKLGLNFIIWRDRIWLDYDGQWGAYSKGGWGKHLEESRGWNTTTRHMDHVHAEIDAP